MEKWLKWIIILSVIIITALLIFIIIAAAVHAKKKNQNNLGEKKFSKSILEKDIFHSGTEVFYYNDGDNYLYDNHEEAEEACKTFGATLATFKELEEAYLRGAEWCGYGWTKDKIQAYPMGEDANTCEGKAGIVEGEFEKAGAICIGQKPVLNTHGILAFRPGYWHMKDF